jgi:hypothetical protein
MLYRIKTSKELFDAWKELEQDFGVKLLSSTLQNDMYLTHEVLNEEFAELHRKLLELQEKFTPTYIKRLTDLRDRTANYIKESNKTPITKEEFKDFRRYCPNFLAQYEAGADKYSKIEPILTHCNHKSNPIDHEGNCGTDVCPLLK